MSEQSIQVLKQLFQNVISDSDVQSVDVLGVKYFNSDHISNLLGYNKNKFIKFNQKYKLLGTQIQQFLNENKSSSVSPDEIFSDIYYLNTSGLIFAIVHAKHEGATLFLNYLIEDFIPSIIQS